MANLLYAYDNEQGAAERVALSDLILTKGAPTTAGSRMLDGFMSLFDAEVVERLQAAGFALAGKANVGEFAADFLGETSYYGTAEDAAGSLSAAASEIIAAGEASAVVDMDVNGAPRRAAALAGQVCVKPTYGTVSRYGTISVACSGEVVCVNAADVAGARAVLEAIVGHDNKDGTSLPEVECDCVKTAQAGPATRVAILTDLYAAADPEVQARIDAAAEALRAEGVTVDEYELGIRASIGAAHADSLPTVAEAARAAWNVLFAAELCNNVSRYDGVKYGYRTDDYMEIDELYTNSRTEAFGELLKYLILFGSDALSTDRYAAVYDKALRIRRVVCESLAAAFGTYDALLLPACSRAAYALVEVQAAPFLAFEENLFTALSSISGMPAVVAGGVQLIGPALSDQMLLATSEILERAQGRASAEGKEVR